MSDKKIRVINNIDSALGFYLNANQESLKVLKKQGSFIDVYENELDYVFHEQEIIQKGMLWIEDKTLRIKYQLENEDGTKENQNVLKHDEIKVLIEGNYKKLEKVLNEITEPIIIQQFVEVARELKIDSKVKIDIIEKVSKMKIYEDED